MHLGPPCGTSVFPTGHRTMFIIIVLWFSGLSLFLYLFGEMSVKFFVSGFFVPLDRRHWWVTCSSGHMTPNRSHAPLHFVPAVWDPSVSDVSL